MVRERERGVRQTASVIRGDGETHAEGTQSPCSRLSSPPTLGDSLLGLPGFPSKTWSHTGSSGRSLWTLTFHD